MKSNELAQVIPCRGTAHTEATCMSNGFHFTVMSSNGVQCGSVLFWRLRSCHLHGLCPTTGGVPWEAWQGQGCGVGPQFRRDTSKGLEVTVDDAGSKHHNGL